MRLTWTLAVAGLLLSACGSLTLIDQQQTRFPGAFNSAAKTLEASVNGVHYRGNYITNASVSQGFVIGSVGAKPVSGQGLVTNSGNAGRAFLQGTDGSTMECEFNYQGMTAIGSCRDSRGGIYQLVTN